MPRDEKAANTDSITQILKEETIVSLITSSIQTIQEFKLKQEQNQLRLDALDLKMQSQEKTLQALSDLIKDQLTSGSLIEQIKNVVQSVVQAQNVQKDLILIRETLNSIKLAQQAFEHKEEQNQLRLDALDTKMQSQEKTLQALSDFAKDQLTSESLIEQVKDVVESVAQAQNVQTEILSLDDKLQELAEANKLRQDFTMEIFDDAKKTNDLLKSIHTEIVDHNEDIQLSILGPIFHELIEMYNNFSKLVQITSSYDEQRATDYKVFQETIEAILERHQVTLLNFEDDKYDKEKQEILRPLIETSDPKQHNLVKERVKSGFRYEGSKEKILQKESVRVYRYVGTKGK